VDALNRNIEYILSLVIITTVIIMFGTYLLFSRYFSRSTKPVKQQEIINNTNSNDTLSDTLRADFDSASNHVRQSAATTLPSNELLFLYGRYKRVLDGVNYTEKPSFYRAADVQKWQAWSSVSDKSAIECAEEYIDRVQTLDCGWTRGQSVKGNAGFGLRPSRMVIEENYDDGDNTESEFLTSIKDGDVVKLKAILSQVQSSELLKELLNTQDDELLSPLHWACDRGRADIVEILLSPKNVKLIDVNCVDSENKTPLHYAATVDAVHCVRLLLSAGARIDLVDVDGLTAIQCAEDENTINAFVR